MCIRDRDGGAVAGEEDGVTPAFEQGVDVGPAVAGQEEDAGVGEKGLEEGQAQAVLGCLFQQADRGAGPVSYTHLRAHETVLDLVCRLLLEKKKISTDVYPDYYKY